MGSRQASPLRPHRQPAIRHTTHDVVQLISVALTAKSTNPTSPPSNSGPKSALPPLNLTFEPLTFASVELPFSHSGSCIAGFFCVILYITQ